MSRELWSQAGEPTWAIDERLRRLEDRVNDLAAVVAALVAEQAARDLPAGPGVTGPVGSSGRAAGAGQPCRPASAASDGGSRGGA